LVLEELVEGKRSRLLRRDKLASPSPDLVNRDFSANGADQLYVSDLTYIPTKEGWLFLVAILDVFTRRIVGWSMAREMRTQLFLDALRHLQIT
jgi:putative transposase